MSIRTFLFIYCTLMMSHIAMLSTYFVVYVLYLNYIPPMPFSGIIGYLSLPISWVALWFSIPQEKRIETKQRRQYKFYVMYKLLTSIVIVALYQLLTIALKKIPSDFQWILGFALPIIREICSWLRRKILSRAFEERRYNPMQFIQIN